MHERSRLISRTRGIPFSGKAAAAAADSLPELPLRIRTSSEMRAHRKRVFNFVIAMGLIALLSRADGREPPSQRPFSNFEKESSSSCLQRGWKSRRLFQDRPAPRGFPPPDSNALIHNPQRTQSQKTPASKTLRAPDNHPPPPPLKIPPPHP